MTSLARERLCHGASAPLIAVLAERLVERFLKMTVLASSR
jgi:hypothetical protein